MGLLRFFIIKEWFLHFLGGGVVLFLLVSVAHLISNFLRDGISGKEVFINYLGEVPMMLTQILAVSCLIASLFSINKLKNRNELTAIFASGFSRRDYLITIFFCAFSVSVFQFYINGYLQPQVQKARLKYMEASPNRMGAPSGQGLKASTIGSGKIWYKTDKYFFSFSAFDKQTQSLSQISIYEYDASYKLQRKIEARKAEYLHDETWRLVDGKEFLNLNTKNFPTVNVFTSKEDIIHETPGDFVQIDSDITLLNFHELYEYIQKLKEAGINTDSYEIRLYERIGSPIICILFALLSGTLIFNPNRRSSSFGKNLMFVFVFVLLYWLANSYMAALGIGGRVSPLLTSFFVPIVFTFYLTYYFYRHRQLR